MLDAISAEVHKLSHTLYSYISYTKVAHDQLNKSKSSLFLTYSYANHSRDSTFMHQNCFCLELTLAWRNSVMTHE
jgi:hypothetical protein